MRRGKIRYTKVVTYEYFVDLDDDSNETNFYLERGAITVEQACETDVAFIKEDGDRFIVDNNDPIAHTETWNVVTPEGDVVKTIVVDRLKETP